MADSNDRVRPLPGVLIAALGAVVLLFIGAAGHVHTAAPALPATLERYLNAEVRPSASERQRLLNGQPLTRVLESSANPQVSVFGAIWVDAPMQRYVAAVGDIETWEQGRAFRVTRRISSPPRIEDFDRLRLSAALVDDLRRCRVGACEVKLDARTIELFRTSIDWNSPQRHGAAEALMRRFVQQYATAYLAGGNSRLATFSDRAVPVAMADEFRAMVDDMPILTSYLPDVRRYLLEYPNVSLPGASSFLYWQETEFGLKPTIRLSHLTIRDRPDEVVVASKMIYANHYFRSALELRVLLPDPARGRGFWLMSVVTSRTDGMTGFTGLFVRRRVRNEAREGTSSVLVGTKRKLEAAP